MTTQYSIARSISGQAGSSIKLFATGGADTVLYTADSVTERTNAKGQYLATFGEAAVIPAGIYTQIHFSSVGTPLSIGERSFNGTDGETATDGTAIIKSTVRREAERLSGIRDWGVYADAALISPSTGDNNLSTWCSVVKISGVWHCYYSSGSGVIRHVSLGADGKTVGATRTTVLNLGASGSYDEGLMYSPIVRIEGTTLKMWYAALNAGSDRLSIAYAIASTSDPLTWTKVSVAVAPEDAPDWVHQLPSPCGMKKFNGLYYLYGTVDADLSVLTLGYTPIDYSDRRAWVATSVNGISDWTFYPLLGASTDIRSFNDEYIHLISATSFTYVTNSETRHYLLASTGGANSDYQQVQLFESCDPLFPENATRWLGTVLYPRPYAETFPTAEIDVLCVTSDDIACLLLANVEFKMYFGGRSAGGFWSIGLATQPSTVEALRPPYRSWRDMQPNLLRQMVERNVDGDLQLRAGVAVLDPPTATKIDQILEDTGTTLPAAIAAIEGGGGSATLKKQEEILAAIQGTEVIQVASPNVQGNLVLTQGDSYDGIANPKASWTVATDYSDGWAVMLTIRGEDDAVIYSTAGTVVSATVVAVQIAAPTGLTMSGCPGQWQGKFDVQLTKAGSKKTIALGVCYINEDQTR